ncbi:uncharacterized protein LY89DRAFT_755911 [Mollisia scopiformis]|uniref:Uncharacterized protein n=1 Tax=Mollisia scopiformis TaxID=149040 RepID=A0A194WYZ6_MOLSC|nr:uncharacterized protein LY89DRAFT_755911 [Mollisia scopiformis]KUJ12817.1 hypothetical protein LY89DRAFT_755911 [Mollisia scopiformis]
MKASREAKCVVSTLPIAGRSLELETTQSVPNNKGHNVVWQPDSELSNINVPRYGELDGNSQEEFREALASISDLGCLSEATLESVVSRLDKEEGDIVLEIAHAARRARLSSNLREHTILPEEEPHDDEGVYMEEIPFCSPPSKSEDETETALQRTTYKSLLFCIDRHIDFAVVCTYCQALHTGHTTELQCPTVRQLSRSSTKTSTPSCSQTRWPRVPKYDIFPRPMNFSKLQLAMKLYRNQDFSQFSAITISFGRRKNKNQGPKFFWGGYGVDASFSVSKSSPSFGSTKGEERIMYRTQFSWFLLEKHRNDAEVLRLIEEEMRNLNSGNSALAVRSLCSHVSGTFWSFENPKQWTGVRRCKLCALEWEVCLGEVSSQKLEENTTDVTRKETETKKKNKGLLVVLTCWRDFGMCKSIDDPRWMAHFATEYSHHELSDTEITKDNSWDNTDLEEPAQNWELGGIKKAFEGIDEYPGQGDDGEGDLKWRLEEKQGKALKLLVAAWKGVTSTALSVRFQ